MKKYISLAIFGIIFLVLAIFIIERACPRSDAKYQKLKGELTEARKQLKESKDALVEKTQEGDEEKEKKDEEIKELKEKNKKLDQKVRESQKRDEERAQAINDIKKEGETLTDPILIIANRNLLVEQWEARFWNEREEKNLIIKQRNNWAAQAFKQYGKYQIEHGIRFRLEKQLAGQEALDEIAAETVNEGDKVIRGLSLKLNFKNILYSAAFFGLGYVVGAAK